MDAFAVFLVMYGAGIMLSVALAGALKRPITFHSAFNIITWPITVPVLLIIVAVQMAFGGRK